ncbi:MAG TPA: four helix bundle protein [Candidatus Magasanikbacteria bacterium]|nr:four helix bundle protein [Candidatus Magasanikbacteria bacterium]
MVFITLENLKIYQLSREYSTEAWEIYSHLDWQKKKVIGDQYIRSVDSVGANIAEAHGRYHYLDKNKFFYNARGSLYESKHWLDLLYERNIITKERYNKILDIYNNIQRGLNGAINSNLDKKLAVDE